MYLLNNMLTQEQMNGRSGDGLFTNMPIDSNDSPAGNNQQACSAFGYPAGCLSSTGN